MEQNAKAGWFSSTFAQNQTWQSHTFQAWLTRSIYQWQSSPGTQGWDIPNSSWIPSAKPPPLPHLPADKAALWVNSSLTFLFRDFTRGFGTDSLRQHPGALYFSCLVCTRRLEFRFQFFCLQNPQTPFWALLHSFPWLQARGETGHREFTASCPVCSGCFLAHLITCCT